MCCSPQGVLRAKGEMSSKSTEDSCKKLVALGFSKTKAQKALKDCGNMFTKAKEMLERQSQQSEKEQQQSELIKKRQQEDEERRKVEADLRALGFTPANQQQAVSKESKRQHPCIVQYKSCRYGKFCLLKELPGDVCISHFNSSCIYGSACRNRHTIDGVDIRHYVPNAPNAPPVDEGVVLVQGDGGVVVAKEVRGGVVLADVTYPSGQRPVVEGRQLAQAPEYMWNTVRGSEGSYSDPLQQTAWDGSAPGDAIEGPTPFLDLARQHRGNLVVSNTAQKVRATEAPQQVQQKPVRFGELGFMAHPCMLQCGGCKYGDACNHATRPADVCVYFLNGRCSYADHQCRFRHDDSMSMAPAPSMAALRQQLQAPQVSPTIAHSPSMHASKASPSIGFILKSNTVVGGQPMSMWSLGDNVDQLERQYAAPQRSNFSAAQQGLVTTTAEGSPARLHTLHGLYNNASVDTTNQPPPQSRGAGSPSGPAPSSLRSQEEEGRSFVVLREVFPAADPGFLLHALRLANGDRSRVADAIAASHANEDTNTLAALLVQESQLEDQRLGNASCSSDGLLSLCAVFPNLEPSLIEDALARAEGDAGSAFAMLVGSAEHRTTTTSSSSSTSASDVLKLERLRSMFPDVPQEVIKECFAGCGGSTQKSIQGLTHLVEDLKSMDDRTRAGDNAMRSSFLPGTEGAQVTDGNGDDDHGGSFSVTADSLGGGGFSVVAAAALPSQTELYHSVAQEALELGDWRRTRERAYFVNACRFRVLAMAAQAYANGNGRGAKQLSLKGAELGAEYRKLNMLAMRALEDERNTGSHSVSVLDLHGFHVDEAIDVCMRRLLLCQQKSVSRVKMIIGRGAHSAMGKSTVFPAVLDALRQVPQIAATWQVVSVKPAVIEVARRWDG